MPVRSLELYVNLNIYTYIYVYKYYYNKKLFENTTCLNANLTTDNDQGSSPELQPLYCDHIFCNLLKPLVLNLK